MITLRFMINLLKLSPRCLLHDHPSSFLKLGFYNQVFQPRLFDLQLKLADSIINRLAY